MMNAYRLNENNIEQFAELVQTELAPETGEEAMQFAQYYENKGKEQGQQLGIAKGLKMVAKRMLEQGSKPADIAELTGLTEAEIQGLGEE